MSHSPPSPAPRIRAFASAGRNRVRVELDDGTSFEVPDSAIAREGLSRDDPLDDALRARLEEAGLAARARDAALRLLALRARSRAELRRRLRRKDLPSGVVEACLDDLERLGLLDDAAFARAVVRLRVKRSPRGPVRLRQELRTRGVDETVAGAAIERVLDDERLTTRTLAARAALAWLKRQSAEVVRALADEAFSEERQRARRRLAGHLARRGFTGEAAIAGLDAVRERAGGS